LEAGNWRTAKFMLFDDEAIIFDHGIAEDFVAGVVHLFAPGFGIRARQINFEIFADMDSADAFVAHLFEGVLHGFALGVQDGLLWSDDYFRFHLERRAPQHARMLGKPPACANLFPEVMMEATCAFHLSQEASKQG
jgi:hypothetical protein